MLLREVEKKEDPNKRSSKSLLPRIRAWVNQLVFEFEIVVTVGFDDCTAATNAVLSWTTISVVPYDHIRTI